MFGCEQKFYDLTVSITYSNNLPDESEFFDLFETTGWNHKYQLSSSELRTALEKSWYCLSAYENEKLIGFGRILCDGVVHALILDLIVLPKFMGKGIGGKILEDLVKKCKDHKIRDIQLFCAKGYSGYYEKRGFKKRPDNAPGMEIRLNQ